VFEFICLVEPVDGHPLWLGLERIDGLDEIGEAAAHVLVDNGQVKVGVVVALDALALLHHIDKVGLAYVDDRLIDRDVLEVARIQALELHAEQVVDHERTLDKDHVGHELLVAKELEGLGRAVHDAHLARLDHLADGVQLGAIQVAVVLAPLEVLAASYVRLHLLPCLEVVAAPVLLVLTHWSRRILKLIENVTLNCLLIKASIFKYSQCWSDRL
jgi:hypothetical protein